MIMKETLKDIFSRFFLTVILNCRLQTTVEDSQTGR